MSLSTVRPRGNLRFTMSAFLVCALGATAGVAATPNRAAAASAETTGWSCVSLYQCGYGSSECCRWGNGSDMYCTTACPVIIS